MCSQEAMGAVRVMVVACAVAIKPLELAVEPRLSSLGSRLGMITKLKRVWHGTPQAADTCKGVKSIECWCELRCTQALSASGLRLRGR